MSLIARIFTEKKSWAGAPLLSEAGTGAKY